MKNRPTKNARFKKRSSDRVRLKKKNDQLLLLYIAVDRFYRRTISLDLTISPGNAALSEVWLLAHPHPSTTDITLLRLLDSFYRSNVASRLILL